MSERYKIASFDFATQDVYNVIQATLPENFELVTLKTGTLEEKIENARDADFFMAATGAIPAEVIRAGKKLKFIQQQGVGYDKTDVALATELGIEVCITPEGTSVGVSEHVVLLILAVYKKLVKISNEMHEGKFPMWDYRTQSYEIFGKTVGFVGFGRIAREAAKRLAVFEANIIFYDPFFQMPKEEQEKMQVTQMEKLDDLLALADIVSVHVPSSPETKGFVNKGFFHKMKKSAIFINTARGDLVNEADFFAAIKNHDIAGAGIDVYPKEPLPSDNEYIKLENVTVTPHISAGTVDALQTKIRYASANILRFINGEETYHSVNKEALAKRKR